METAFSRWCRAATSFVNEKFHDRQLLVRGPDTIASLKLSKRQQLCGAGAFLVVVLWTSSATICLAMNFGSLSHAARLERQLAQEAAVAESKVADAQAANHAAVTQVLDMAAKSAAMRDAAEQRETQIAAHSAAAISQLTAQVEASIGTVQGIIKSTGLNPGQFAAAITQPTPVPSKAAASDAGSANAAPASNQSSSLNNSLLLDDTLLNDVGRLQSLSAVLDHLPVTSPLRQVSVTSGFGYRASPFTGLREFHVGVDLRGPVGTPVYATAPGIVTRAGVATGYGNLIVIDHGFGLSTRYSHLEKMLVKSGDSVALHQEIGLLGNTGWSTGPHLLYETRIDDTPLNPLNFIKAYP